MLDINSFNKLNEKNEDWILKYKKDRFDIYNNLEIPKWKRIRLDKFSLPEYQSYNKEYIFFDNKENKNVIVKNIDKGLNENEKTKDYLCINDEYGISEKFVSMGESLYNCGAYIYVLENEKVDTPIKINYSMDKENPIIIDQNIIVAKENSEVTVIMDYSTIDDIKSFHNGVTKIFAHENAVVNLIKIQQMNDSSNHFDSNVAFVKGYGKVNCITVELGSQIGATSFVTNLNGDNSEADLKSIYFGDKERKLDIGYTINHRGVRSLSNIDCKGALKDKSKKVFRGNLDFKLGSRRSKGSEKEFVLLLDKTVKSDAIPALLCQEDDVEGEHAASAGQINENKLYYLMSRGFDEKEAKKLIVEASFRPIIDEIPDENIRNNISENIHRRLING